MDWLFKLAKPLIKRILIKQLSNDKTQQMIIDLVNAKVDLPLLDEEDERALLTQLYGAIYAALEKVADDL